MYEVIANFIGIQEWGKGRFSTHNMWLYNTSDNSTRALMFNELITMLISKN